ncbi:MAG: pseudouridine synthase [Rikenellaceae bacterium]
MEKTFDKKGVNKTLFATEKSENSPREERSSRKEAATSPLFGASRRRSFNPNFSEDNHVYGERKKSSSEQSYNSNSDNSGADASSKRKRPRIKKEPLRVTERIDPTQYPVDIPKRSTPFSERRSNVSDRAVDEFLHSEKGDNRGGRFNRPDRRPTSRFNTKVDRDFNVKSDRGVDTRRSGVKNKFKKKRKDEEPFFLQPNIEGSVRLNRFVAMSGVCSRRDADELIASGAITVNGSVVTELGTKVTADDVVCNNGLELRGEKLVYIVMNKPKGIVTTVEDPNAEKTVIDLLQGKVKERVFPVGRLDKNSLGLILLTNDGELTKELTHPSFEKKKIYHVFLDKPVVTEDIEKLAEGIELEDGLIYADELSYVEDNPREVGIEIHSGRNRIVRRMFEHIGYRVIKLDRVYFAGITKKGLKRGFWRYLTAQEVIRLKNKAFN